MDVLLAWNAKRDLTDRVDHQEAGGGERKDASGRGVGKAVEAHELAVSIVNLVVRALELSTVQDHRTL